MQGVPVAVRVHSCCARPHALTPLAPHLAVVQRHAVRVMLYHGALLEQPSAGVLNQHLRSRSSSSGSAACGSAWRWHAACPAQQAPRHHTAPMATLHAAPGCAATLGVYAHAASSCQQTHACCQPVAHARTIAASRSAAMRAIAATHASAAARLRGRPRLSVVYSLQGGEAHTTPRLRLAGVAPAMRFTCSRTPGSRHSKQPQARLQSCCGAGCCSRRKGGHELASVRACCPAHSEGGGHRRHTHLQSTLI